MDAATVIARLGLTPHPEGGAYRETFREPDPAGGRDRTSAIYYLLAAGEVSHWHRVDASEVWHHYTGDPLALAISPDGVTVERIVLGSDLAAGHRPQAVVPAWAWQSAETRGAWTLAGATVTPAFTFDGFELAPADWAPGVS
ncbi:hypothetical protein SAMN05216241_10983 [Limimonas halophila]|uniref:DUF985 domain-containing protein n=1 Tax=Limimonas halophila TaxID=1082479 RepID=A0A1G7TIS9_9PROT|nr:cupin domain-containing protein [Limimonas halophila]SDG34559.1 hypothetical protein SAMN05216241_10983 [Limimonas halophila]